MEVFLHRLNNAVWIQFDVAHHLGEHVPFALRERQKEMFIGEQRMLASAGFFGGAVHDALRGVANLARCDIEIFNVHSGLRLVTLMSKSYASRSVAAWPQNADVDVDRLTDRRTGTR